MNQRPTTFRTTRTGAVVTAAAFAHAPPTQVDGLAVGRRNGPASAEPERTATATTAMKKRISTSVGKDIDPSIPRT
jgi:hypothetical protein